jgi:uncharacterized CHY-type Zn-finger protein
MIAQNTESQAVQCVKCKKSIQSFEDSYFCVYCKDPYCPPCLGYCKFYDLQ